MSFKTIETQEELDRIIQDRIARERDKFADYDELKTKVTDYETQVATLQKAIDESNTTIKSHDDTVAELNSKIASYETSSLRTRIAIQNGLPLDLAERLVGNDEESIKADAERLASFVAKPKAPSAPLKDLEPPLGDDKNSNWRQMASNLTGEGE
ncbi:MULTISPECIES: capsid assembly scaffolding protein Gp46 family protein [Lactobacillales]|uniref:capsid assembly scaffolding protein Gp46 family protein n=1 Tax=Lactobacillales TaxID=186826 RepID=UPI00026C868D|nr:DUF4355 domain-containing protein [Carnobacterium maltaromaticum]